MGQGAKKEKDTYCRNCTEIVIKRTNVYHTFWLESTSAEERASIKASDASVNLEANQKKTNTANGSV